MKNNKKILSLILGSLFVIPVISIAQNNSNTQIDVVKVPMGTPIPGTSDSLKHNELVHEENKRNAENALKSGKSSVPRLTSQIDSSAKDPFDIVPKKPEPPKTITDPKIDNSDDQNKRSGQKRSEDLIKQQPQVITQIKKSQETLDREKEMAKSIQGLLAGWVPVDQRIEVDFKGVGGSLSGASGSASSVNSLTQGPSNGSSVTIPGANQQVSSLNPNQSSQINNLPDIKTGHILNAVVMTSVNSDEPGPVLAQIVSGPYAGAKIMGSFKMNQMQEKLLLTFTVINIPTAKKSYAINGYAIDPDSGRTALVSDVDHHYFQRYGMLLGASFLKGYSNALKSSNTTSQVASGAAGTTITQTTPQLSSKDKALTALGDVGTAIAGTLNQSVNRANTVTLNAGTPLGILIMQDVVLH